ncbi:hypothetical protein ACNF42_08030 [Cuniculiplasma sp. SKW3]|uniref:hypothetical protein n=1 Tax=Cuniculiplasma sp. SKW3 TaxID=3400170 RepID=UPI003FD42654
MIVDTSVDYKYPPDRRAEAVLRAIQDRERKFQHTFASDLYIALSGIPRKIIRSSNQINKSGLTGE